MKSLKLIEKLIMVGVIAVLLLAACAPTPTEQAAPAAEEPAAEVAEPTRIALLMPGPITDGSWNQLAYEGLQELGKDANFEIAYAENIAQAKIPEVSRGYADDGYELIIGHGFEFGSAFLEIAPEYPNQLFFATTFQPQADYSSNLRFVDAAYFPAAYTAGALAAMMSESHVVGFVGGGDNPTQQGMMKSFQLGAEKTVAGTKALGVVTGDYNDAAKGRESATTMIGNGADVIWHAADVTGLGAIEGAVASKTNVLGCYSDQTSIAPDYMGASLVMDLDNMVITLANDVRDGKFVGGEEWRPPVSEMWHWAAGDAEYNSKIIPDAMWQEYMKVWDDVASGKIDVAALLK